MNLKEKHAKLWDLYWTKFVNINPVVSGYCVPLEYISDNKGYAGDGTINMAELLTLLQLRRKNGRKSPVDVLDVLIKMENLFLSVREIIERTILFLNILKSLAPSTISILESFPIIL